jgi:hypothetical protein
VLRHSLTKYGVLSRIDRIEKRQNILSGNPIAIPLSVDRCFVLERGPFRAIEKFYRPATPLPLPLYATAGSAGMAERKDFVPKSLCHCL